MDSTVRLSGRVIAAGRALAGISQKELAVAADLPEDTFRLLEASGAAWAADENTPALCQALESFGVAVIQEGDGMGAGVRLKFTRQDTRQIGRLEGEGGVVGSDHVP